MIFSENIQMETQNMDQLYKEIKDALPKRLNSKSNVEKVEESLKTSLAALKKTPDDDKCFLLLKSGILYLITITRLTTTSSLGERLESTLTLILDCMTVASDHGRKSSSYVASIMTDKCLDAVLSDKFAFSLRMEVLSRLNFIYEFTDTAVKEHLLEKEDIKSKLSCLFQLVLCIGDYEFQVSIVECMCRLIPRKLRQKYSRCFIPDPKLLQEFLAVKDSCFEVDCRKFLNHVNNSQKENRKVYSIPCQRITVGAVELQKPRDEGYDEFWLDINMGSERLIVFCENAHLSSQSSSDDCWETFSVWQADVLKCVCHEERGQLTASLYIKSTAACVPRGYFSDSPFIMRIVTDHKHGLKTALCHLFHMEGISQDVTEAHRPAEVRVRNTMKKSIGKHSTDLPISSQERKRKASVPSDTMSTPASCVSLASFRASASFHRDSVRFPSNAGGDTTQQAGTKTSCRQARKRKCDGGDAFSKRREPQPDSEKAGKCAKIPQTQSSERYLRSQKAAAESAGRNLQTSQQKDAKPSAVSEERKSQLSQKTQASFAKTSVLSNNPRRKACPKNKTVENFTDDEKLQRLGNDCQTKEHAKRRLQDSNATCKKDTEELDISSVQQHCQTSGHHIQTRSKGARNGGSSLSYPFHGAVPRSDDLSVASYDSQLLCESDKLPQTAVSVITGSEHADKKTDTFSQEVRSHKEKKSDYTAAYTVKRDSVVQRHADVGVSWKDEGRKLRTRSLSESDIDPKQAGKGKFLCQPEMPEVRPRKSERLSHRASAGISKANKVTPNKCDAEKLDQAIPESKILQKQDTRTGVSSHFDRKEGSSGAYMQASNTKDGQRKQLKSNTSKLSTQKEHLKTVKGTGNEASTGWNRSGKNHGVQGKEKVADIKESDRVKHLAGHSDDCDVSHKHQKLESFCNMPSDVINETSIQESEDSSSSQKKRWIKDVTFHQTVHNESYGKSGNASSDEKSKCDPYISSTSDDIDLINYRLEIETDINDGQGGTSGWKAQNSTQQNVCGKRSSEKLFKESTVLSHSNNSVTQNDICTSKEAPFTLTGEKIQLPVTPKEVPLKSALKKTPLKPATDNNYVLGSTSFSQKKAHWKDPDLLTGAQLMDGKHSKPFSHHSLYSSDNVQEPKPQPTDKHQNDSLHKSSYETKDTSLDQSHVKYKLAQKHSRSPVSQAAKQSDHSSLMRETLHHSHESNIGSVSHLWNLRKRQPVSYKESPESVKTFDEESYDGRPMQKQPLRSTGQRYVSSKTGQRISADHKIATSVSNWKDEMHLDKYKSDVYDIDRESVSVRSYTGSDHHLSVKDTATGKEGKLTKKLQGKTSTPGGKTFSLNDDYDLTKASSGTYAKVKEPEVKGGSGRRGWRESSVSPIKFITPDHAFPSSDDSQAEAKQHRLFVSQQKMKQAKYVKEHGKKCGRQAVMTDKNETGSRRDRKPSTRESVHYLSDLDSIDDIKSEVSWIAKYKSSATSDTFMNKTYKRIPSNQLTDTCLDTDLESSSPEQSVSLTPGPLVGITGKLQEAKQDSAVSTPCQTEDISDYQWTSAKSKRSFSSAFSQMTSVYGSAVSGLSLQSGESSLEKSAKSNREEEVPASKSQESLDTDLEKSQRLQSAAEMSPSPSQSTLRCIPGNATPAEYPRKPYQKPNIHEEKDPDEEVTRLRNMGLLSGPSSVMRPSRSVLKRRFPDCSDSEDAGEDASVQSSKTPHLQPRELFPDDLDSMSDTTEEKTKTSKRKSDSCSKSVAKKNITEEADKTEMMRPALEFSDEEMLSQEMDDSLSLPKTEFYDEELGPGMTTLLKGFGLDLQKHIKERKQQVHQLAKNVLKLSSNRVNQLWTTEKNQWNEVLDDFKEKIQIELSALEQDVADWNIIEKKAEDTYLEQLEVLHNKREVLQRRVNTVKKCHADLRMKTRHIQGQSHEMQKIMEVKIKQDMEQLKNKILLDMQQQQFRRVKESLQKHFI